MEWTVQEVREKIKEKYSEEIAKNFEEQEIDGRALIYLAREGSFKQLEACGLLKVGDQLRLKEFIAEVPVVSQGRRNKKPSISEIKAMPQLNQRIYKAKRKAVSEAAIVKWPGNNIPVFRTDIKAKKELDELVEALADDCLYEPAGFDKQCIKQHILDVLNERRRKHRNGHDYTQIDKRKLKRRSHDESKESGASTSTNTSDASSCSDTVILDQDSDEDSPQSKRGHPHKNEDVDCLDEASSSDSCPDSMPTEKNQEAQEELEVPVLAAKIIVQVAFNAVRFQDVAKRQITTCVKKYGLATFKNVVNMEKEKAAQLLSKYLLDEKIVQVGKKNLGTLTRADVTKVRSF